MSRLDRALQTMFPATDPSPADLQRVEQSYRRRIGEARRHRRRVVEFAVAAAVVVVVVAFAAVQPSAVMASLTEIAHAARTVEPDALPDGEYFLTESTSTFEQTINLDDPRDLTYLIDEHRRVWVSRDGTQIVVQFTRTNPVFQRDDDRDRYYDSGFDAVDQLDSTQTSAVEGASHDATEREWPLEADALLQAIRDLPNVSTDTQAAAQLLNLITESPAPPELRAVTIEAIARLDLELVEQPDGGATIRTTPGALDDQIIEFTLDAQGQLRQRTDTNHNPTDPAADAVVNVVEYSPTIVIEGHP